MQVPGWSDGLMVVPAPSGNAPLYRRQSELLLPSPVIDACTPVMTLPANSAAEPLAPTVIVVVCVDPLPPAGNGPIEFCQTYALTVYCAGSTRPTGDPLPPLKVAVPGMFASILKPRVLLEPGAGGIPTVL